MVQYWAMLTVIVMTGMVMVMLIVLEQHIWIRIGTMSVAHGLTVGEMVSSSKQM